MEKTKPKKPHFFKPILPGFNQQLVIPTSFFRYLIEEKPDGEAILRSDMDVGKSWKVQINKGMCFEAGWKEFAQDHDLHVGDFLVFRHEGDMVFHVMVFDFSTACAKEYLPLHDGEEAKQKHYKKQSGSKKKIKTISKDVQSSSPMIRNVEGKPPYFIAKMNFSNVCPKPVMYIPAQFARSNGLMNRFCRMLLRDKNGRCWEVNLGHTKGNGQVHMRGGWRKFSEDNALRKGDICVFELVSAGEKVVMEVLVRAGPEVLGS